METIIIAACLILSPTSCKNVEVQVYPDAGASLQQPFHCFRQGQIEGQKWLAENPSWKITKWSCPQQARRTI